MPHGRPRKRRAESPQKEEPPQKTAQNDEALLSALEDDWLASRLRGETTVVERLIDETYRGHTSDGNSQTKADFIRAIESPGTRYTEGEQADRAIRVLNDAALSTGVVKLRAGEKSHSFRYLRVYSKHDGEWRLVASQATRLRLS